MFLSIQSNSHSFQSPRRQYNQDLFWPGPGVSGNIVPSPSPVVLTERGHLFVVASGAGMPPYGLEACRLGIQTLVSSYYDEGISTLDIQIGLQASFRAANEVVHDYVQGVPDDIPGCSMVVAVIKDDQLSIGNVGLGGAYLIRETVVDRLVPLPGPSRPDSDRISTVTFLLGSYTPLLVEDDPVDPMQLNPYLELIGDVRVRRGDVLILVSDGFLGLVEEKEMLDVAMSSPETIARRLAQMVSDSLKGSTNVTVTAIRFC